ncbi:hypothetical protein LWI28_007124 [Acer negundo]|uniref:Uncharacterized protein n=1 Tax=Acer negundo TaxID=4023 RepID=A0AAD5ICL8_ACENE|nr:hypothetical protein LWI28_007124 [Acer negundo]
MKPHRHDVFCSLTKTHSPSPLLLHLETRGAPFCHIGADAAAGTHRRLYVEDELGMEFTTTMENDKDENDGEDEIEWQTEIQSQQEKGRGREIVIIVEPSVTVAAARRRCYSPLLSLVSSPLQREVGREEIVSLSLSLSLPSPSTQTSGAVAATVTAAVLAESTHLILRFALD